jgi:hypothetical protein
MKDSINDKEYQELLNKMKKEFHNSEVIQCFVKTEVNRVLHGDALSYEQIKALAANFKKEIAKQSHDTDSNLH